MSDLHSRLRDSLADEPVLRERFDAAAAPFTELRGEDAAAAKLSGARLSGLARLLAADPSHAGFLSHRPGFLEQLASLADSDLSRAEQALSTEADELHSLDLEDALDALRLRRREGVALAACFDLGDAAPFEDISDYLSVLAETSTQRALDLARQRVDPGTELTVIGMGKIAGREFTYHSDLDLVFLYQGGPDTVAPASRIAQRLISFLTTMTGAGVVYAVDTRLRPSGGQGMLVTSFPGFETYQTRDAQTWEHLALLRARPVAGQIDEAAALLERVRGALFDNPQSPWPDLLALRERVESERAAQDASSVPIKTGAGGLMDVDFIAGGGLLEQGCRAFPPLPSVRAMLAAWAGGPASEALLPDYRLLRIVEARARLVAGRPVEALRSDGEELPLISTLVAPGMPAAELLEAIAAARGRIRAALASVREAGSVAPLQSAGEL